MFIDKTDITIKAGDGGSGACSFRREAFVPRGGPNGGDGGNGGDVIFVGDAGQTNLLDFTYTTRYIGNNGGGGKGKDMHGRNGEPIRILVPVGTIIRVKETGELLADIQEEGQEVVVAKGGLGGKGNARFATPTNQAPREYEPGEKTEPIEVTLELKIVADIGLVGYPNAGKSTLLSDLSGANPKIAPYPFTTLHPVVGVVEYPDFHKLTIADIPGLVEGAHRNVGLGHEFLRHIERTRMLICVIDMAGTDGRDPVKDLHDIEYELEMYSPGLSKRIKLIVANKTDEAAAAENVDRLVKDVNKRIPIFPMSAAFENTFDELKDIIRAFLAKIQEAPDATETVRTSLEGIEMVRKRTPRVKKKDDDDFDGDDGDGVEVVYVP